MSTEYQKEQAERRETLENDRRVREQAGTFMSHTHDDLEVGGRFAKETPQTIVGSTPVSNYPVAFHQHDPVPDEPSLGISVDEMIPVGEAHEIERSLGDAERSDDSGFPSADTSATGEPSGDEQRSTGPFSPVSEVAPSPPFTDDGGPPEAA